MGEMKKHLRYMVALLFLVASGLSFGTQGARAIEGEPAGGGGGGSGQWAEVCCGDMCDTDYCIGDGPYTCCK
jgi:hypothetical protein